MTGITPPEFTFSGRCVDCPPIMRRPTIRFAYCTGMRRSERSDKHDERNHRDHHDQQDHQYRDRECAPCLGLGLIDQFADTRRQTSHDTRKKSADSCRCRYRGP